MFEKNEITYLRRSLAAEILRIYFNDNILDEIDKVPIKEFQRIVLQEGVVFIKIELCSAIV